MEQGARDMKDRLVFAFSHMLVCALPTLKRKEPYQVNCLGSFLFKVS